MQQLRVIIEGVLKHFTASQQAYIYDIIDFTQDVISKDTSFFLFKSTKSIDETTSEYKKNLFIEMLEQILIKDTQDNIEIINSGENLLIEVWLRKDEDLSASVILARNDEYDTALSLTTLLGTADRKQKITCIDLPLASGTFYRLNVLSETKDSNGAATGDSNSLLNVVYLYVLKDVDND